MYEVCFKEIKLLHHLKVKIRAELSFVYTLIRGPHFL